MRPKFLVDENVRNDLLIFFKKERINFTSPIKGSTDSQIARHTLKENLVLITNDNDFSRYSKNKVYSVVLLKIHQAKKDELINAFSKLLKQKINYKGKLILLSSEDEIVSNLND